MKKIFYIIFVSFSIIISGQVLAEQRTEIAMSELLKKGYEIKSSMIPTMGGAIVFVLQKSDSAYLCVLDIKKGNTSCDPIR
ncbi:MAG: hypothetical protein D3916_00905 [Candidatus Electrothrix sp. MAN1_4]|nr:hypothetical protein [Candidatus Electrothrix sp. MAN1_4]